VAKEEQINTAFYGVFKGKLEKQKQDLKKELERAKSDRRKEWLRKQIKEAKSMRDLLKKMEKQMGKETHTHCPHCGEKL
jgi:AAA+ ATPase superfamily predicted ATPase